ncbi:MAG: HNH endonuclease [bacterium]
MNLYKTTRWLRLRRAVLRRDEYLCRECRRYGKTTPATTVHHIYPAEQYPQWWMMNWNLLSLCGSCHDKMHDRNSGALTALGREWMVRTSPPAND